MSEPGAREESLGHYEMLWDCPHCDTKKLLGKTHRHCPHCGAPQDPSKRYFPSAADQVRAADHVFVGADKRCGSCGNPMSARADHCSTCGAPLGDAAAVPLVAARPAAPPAPRTSRRRWRWIALGVAAILGLVWFQCLRTKNATLRIAGHRWATAIAIEEYREVSDSDWRDRVPAGARRVHCSSRQRSTREVPDGETCDNERVDKGDGTFEVVRRCRAKTRTVGVDDDYCQYQIDRWTVVDELKRDGRGLEAGWATPPVLSEGAGLGARRIGAKNATWTLELHDGKRVQTCSLSEAAWRKYADGQSVQAKVRAATGNVVCSSL